MITDLILEPYDALGAELVAAAAGADRPDSGIGGVWVYDHFTAMAVDRMWSRDPFVLLGAIAQATERLTIGTLVANIYNRHTVQLAAAINTVQDLAGDRVILGVGSGAAPGSRFAGEHESIGRTLGTAEQRRRDLISTIEDLRTIYETRRLGTTTAIVDDHPRPPIIVGASGEATTRVAALHADGVNLRAGANLTRRIDIARSSAVRDPFEISVFDPRGDSVEVTKLEELGVTRRIVSLQSWLRQPER